MTAGKSGSHKTRLSASALAQPNVLACRARPLRAPMPLVFGCAVTQMTSDTTVVAGIEIPSVSPVFLTVVAIHVLLGIACVITGFMAMLSEKRRGRHPQFGTIYY